MAKNILGLDLGVASIGYAHVIEEDLPYLSVIQQIGVRVNPLTIEEQTNFEKGKPISINADRTLKRGARRMLDRYQDRRKNLIEVLKRANIIKEDTILSEDGKKTTHTTWSIRSRAAIEKIEKEELARVFLAINKKRGYKSSRKSKNEDEGQLIDGMSIAKRLYHENITPGQLVYQLLKEGKKNIPDFYRSDLQSEFDKIWDFQKKFYPEILTNEFYKNLQGKGHRATSASFYGMYKFNTADNKGTREQKRLQAYKWRSDAFVKQLEKEEVAFVITEINSDLNKSSGYLGAISDRSKELFFNNKTVGQYLYQQLQDNPHTRLKNQVFYRQDYLDEFEKIWNTQSQYHPELTDVLKEEVRDIIIFYQRKLKSQKGLVSFCELESEEIEVKKNEGNVIKTIGSRVAPKSSPLFQEFKIWQILHNVEFRNKVTKEIFVPDGTAKQHLFNELNLKGSLPISKAMEILDFKSKDWECNYSQLEGNRTNKSLYEAYLKILDLEGYDVKELLEVKLNKDDVELGDLNVVASDIQNMVRQVFESLNIHTAILDFDAEMDGRDFEQQASYQLWHLLYAYEGDNSNSGNETLYKLLEKKFGFQLDHAKVLAEVILSDDYGSLSTKAMRRIFPFIKENNYSTACELSGYRHSKYSLTTEELSKRQLASKLVLLKKNSLRSPVVEKILNQMINLVNALIDKENDRLEREGEERNFYFDEIRIELARDLKKNAKERAEMTININAATIENEKIKGIIKRDFPNVKNPTKNDIIRYKLYQELTFNAYKDLYTNTKVDYTKLFSKDYDIDHIIPQSRLFDDSFSNKVLVPRQANLDKGNRTSYDYMETRNHQEFVHYISTVETLYKEKKITKAKYQKLLKTSSAIGDGFIERDLRESQYIAKKAKEILFQVTKSVVTTSGSITARLREDWGLTNVMKELNLPKYRMVGLTEWQERKDGNKIEIIKDWTKRNDHRHHAMDALTVAFTKHNHIQYLNYLNARKNEGHKLHNIIIAIENKETELKIDENGNKKRFFKEPISNFRQIVKEHLENVLISHKTKNKVTTKNKNKISGTEGIQVTLTPRGQLHKETVYGKYHLYVSREEKVGAKFDLETIKKVTNPLYKQLLLGRLSENANDAKQAFTGKNALSKNPIYLNADKSKVLPEKVKLAWLEENYSIRKDITPDNFKDEKLVDKILDEGVKRILRTRLAEFGGDSKKAFSDLDKNPIWLNKEKGISIKRVTISGVKNAEALHYKKDHFGNVILDQEGKPMPVDYVSTGNNHHVAIYRDENGNLQETVISFFEAVERVNQDLPIIDKTFNQHLGWRFIFTMKQNELFVFPNETNGFNPREFDLLDPKNKKTISLNLFRVQKFSKLVYGNSVVREYVFRHHLETEINDKKELKEITYKNIKSLSYFENIVKVRVNHLGDIVQVGEY